MARIFVMIKPWSIHHKDEVLRRLDDIGIRLKTINVDSIPEGAMRLQHAQYKDESFFQLMINDLKGKPAVVALYEGNQEQFTSKRDYLRQEFGRDITPLPTLRRNVLHVSGSEQEFKRDFNAWEDYLNENK